MVLEGPMIIIATGALAAFHPGVGFNGQWNLANYGFWRNEERSDEEQKYASDS